MPDVVESDLPNDGWPADDIDAVARKFNGTRPDPRLTSRAIERRQRRRRQRQQQLSQGLAALPRGAAPDRVLAPRDTIVAERGPRTRARSNAVGIEGSNQA